MGEGRVLEDFPRDIELYGPSVPVLHMMGWTTQSKLSEIDRLIFEGTTPTPKRQRVAYVLSELRDEELTSRRVGRMSVTVLEIAFGSVAGAIHSDREYIVPNDLSPDEERSYGTSESNWHHHLPSLLDGFPGSKPETPALTAGE
jgi:hypothetical protein